MEFVFLKESVQNLENDEGGRGKYDAGMRMLGFVVKIECSWSATKLRTVYSVVPGIGTWRKKKGFLGSDVDSLIGPFVGIALSLVAERPGKPT